MYHRSLTDTSFLVGDVGATALLAGLMTLFAPLPYVSPLPSSFHAYLTLNSILVLTDSSSTITVQDFAPTRVMHGLNPRNEPHYFI